MGGTANLSRCRRHKQEKILRTQHVPLPFGGWAARWAPLGYIASDIFARHKRLEGYNVLNPMAMMPMVCQRNSTPYRRDNTLP